MATTQNQLANMFVAQSAAVKDWRLTATGKKLRELARSGNGIFEGTLSELRDKYGTNGNKQYDDDNRRHVWVVMTNTNPRPHSRTYRKYSISWAAI